MKWVMIARFYVVFEVFIIVDKILKYYAGTTLYG
jgi:hypothetical protein